MILNVLVCNAWLPKGGEIENWRKAVAIRVEVTLAGGEGLTTMRRSAARMAASVCTSVIGNTEQQLEHRLLILGGQDLFAYPGYTSFVPATPGT